MTILFLILIVLASVALGFLVLIQNPKGGGLAGNVGGFNNQLMGVKQTTDVLEKGTWLFATIIGVLCLVSTLFIKTASTGTNNMIKDINTSGQAAPQQQQAPAAADTNKK